MIWVIAGTKNARELVGDLAVNGFRVIATTATEYGAGLILPNERVFVRPGAIDGNGMYCLVREHGVRCIVDASHPFSVEVSKNAVAAALRAGVPCLRLERKRVEYSGVKMFGGFDEASRYLEDKTGNVLLTIGSRNLKYFNENAGMKIYARVLPMTDSLVACRAAGINAERIIAMRFPFSKKLSRALYEELDIKYLVLKESGEEGGSLEKIEAARETGVEVIMIDRPSKPDAELFFNHETIISRIKEIFHE